MAGEGRGREMNGAAARWQGVGRGARASRGSPLRPAGAAAGTAEPAGGPRGAAATRDPPALPPRGGQRRGRGLRGVVASPAPAFLLSRPFPPVGWGPRGRRARKEKRSWEVLQDCCDNTARGVGGESEEWDSENGYLAGGFPLATHLLFTTPLPVVSTPTAFLPVNPGTFLIQERKMSCVTSLASKKSPVSKRAATSLVLSKPLPAFSLS